MNKQLSSTSFWQKCAQSASWGYISAGDITQQQRAVKNARRIISSVEDFVETHVCKLCVILRSRELPVVRPHKDIGRRLPLELQQCSYQRVNRVMSVCARKL